MPTPQNPGIKSAVEQRFSPVAENYSTSQVHAQGADLAVMVQAAALTGSERVLDAGCGAGHTALAFAPHVRAVTALDLSLPMLAQVARLAAERGLSNITTRQGDVEQIPFPDHAFDLVVSRYSAHHWPQPQDALAEFRRVLGPGGRLLLGDVVTFDPPALDTFLQAIELLRDPSHVRDHSVGQWIDMLAEAGFTGQVIHAWDFFLEFESWHTRMATPAQNVAMIRALFTGAAPEVWTALKVQVNGDFTIPGALFVAKRLGEGRIARGELRGAKG